MGTREKTFWTYVGERLTNLPRMELNWVGRAVRTKCGFGLLPMDL